MAVVTLCVAALAGAATDAAADATRDTTSQPQAGPYADGVKAVKRGDYAAAIPLFESVVAKEPKNADAYNYLAYSIRQTGDARRAIPIYQKALAIDPKHKGAHEYIGEAYLVLDDLPKAKEHLTVLDKLCFLPCEEYTDLKKAVQSYESSGGRVKPAAKASP